MPICINATTGEVHYNMAAHALHPPDAYQVNNAILISNNNLNNSLSTSRSTTTKYDEIFNGKTMSTDVGGGGGGGGGVGGMMGSKRTSHFSEQQQSANSIHSTATANNGGWSSFDEEAFTSGYQSEANGFLSNSEEYGYNSRCRIIFK